MSDVGIQDVNRDPGVSLFTVVLEELSREVVVLNDTEKCRHSLRMLTDPVISPMSVDRRDSFPDHTVDVDLGRVSIESPIPDMKRACLSDRLLTA